MLSGQGLSVSPVATSILSASVPPVEAQVPDSLVPLSSLFNDTGRTRDVDDNGGPSSPSRKEQSVGNSAAAGASSSGFS